MPLQWKYLVLIVLGVGGSALALSFMNNGIISIGLFSASLFSFLFLILYKNPAPWVAMFLVSSHMVAYAGYTGMRYTWLLLVIVMIPLLFLFDLRNKKLIFWLPLVLFCIYYMLVIVGAKHSINGLWLGVQIEAMLWFWLFQYIRIDNRQIMAIMLFQLIFLILFGFADGFLFARSRLEGPLFSATAYGVVVCSVWAMWFSFQMLSKSKNLILVFIISCLAIYTIILSGTRMGLVGIALTILLVLMAHFFVMTSLPVFTKIQRFLLFACVSLLALFMIWTVIPDTVRVKSDFMLLLSGRIDASTQGRMIVWYLGWEAFLENPLWGLGNGNFREYMVSFSQDLVILKNIPGFHILPHAHNIFLVLLSENGIIGLFMVLFCVFVGVYFAIRTMKNDPEQKAYILSVLIGLMVIISLGMVDAIPIFPTTFLWGVWLVALLYRLEISKKSGELLEN
jgi:O-antigen ligase